VKMANQYIVRMERF